MHFLTNYFDIRNSNDGNYIYITINGKDKKCKTLSDVAKVAYDNSQIVLADAEYDKSESKKKIDELRVQQNMNLKDAFCAQFEIELAEHLEYKKKARDTFINNAIPSAFSAEFTPAKFRATEFYNEVDLSFISCVVYCEEQDALYYTANNSYKLIGSIDEIINKDSKAIFTLASCISKDIAVKLNVEHFDFWRYLYNQVDKATEAFFTAKLLLETLSQSDTEINVDEKLVCVPWKETVTLQFFCDYNKHLLSDWLDRLHSYFVKSIFKYMIPASGVNNDLYNIYYEALSEEQHTFKRYAIKPTHGAKCTFETYLSKLFSERFAICDILRKIDNIPHIISDDSTVAEFSYDNTWLDKLTNQVDFKDAKILSTFISPYTEEEKIALMAWAYTVIHPSLNDNIHLLFMTGGGTFKTNYYCAMIKKILTLAYNSKRSLTHTMQGDRWITDSFLRESTTTGISNVALVNADECTDKCLEQFKSMSGGTNEGMSYQKRMMRENPISMKIFCKWLFTTNKFFSISDTSGAFDRRLLIINRMRVQNLPKPYSAAEFDKHIYTEIKAFYTLAKLMYEKMLKTAPTLQEYRTLTPLQKNMSLAYNEEDKQMLYYELYNELAEQHTDRDREHRLKIPSSELTVVVSMKCKEAHVNENGFLNWIETTTDTVLKNIKKPIKLHNSQQPVRGWVLSKLKPEIIAKIEQSVE